MNIANQCLNSAQPEIQGSKTHYHSLFDYYIQNHGLLVYRRYDFHDLNNPIAFNNRKYFATVLCDMRGKS
jgi:hypothetical protein